MSAWLKEKLGPAALPYTGACGKLGSARSLPLNGVHFTLYNFSKSEQACEQVVLIIDSPIASEAEAVLQLEHRFETRNRSARCAERLEAADLRQT